MLPGTTLTKVLIKASLLVCRAPPQASLWQGKEFTVLVDTDGLPSVPCSFALAFAFLAASRFFLASDTISLRGLDSRGLAGKLS